MLAPRARRLVTALRRLRRDPEDVEAVHDARVAARRIHAAARLWLPETEERARLLRRTRRVVRRLGRARNDDIAAGFLNEALPGGMRAGHALSAALRDRRNAGRADLERWLTRGRIRRTEEAVGQVLARARAGGRTLPPGPAELRPFLRRVLSPGSGPGLTSDVAGAHAIRRAARALRYAHETLAAAFPPEIFRECQLLLRRLQDAAGSWNDRVMLLALVRKLGRKSGAAVPARLTDRLKKEMKVHGNGFEAALASLAGARDRLFGTRPTPGEEPR